MQRKVGALCSGFLCVLSLLSASCVGPLQEEIQRLHQQVNEIYDEKTALQRKVEDLQSEFQSYQIANDFALMKVSSRIECDDVKVRDFLKECEEGSQVCSSDGLANAMKFIATQPYVLVWLRPEGGVVGLASTRKGQLLTLTEVTSLKPSSRFLILVSPRTDSEAHQKEALSLGREMQQLMREEYRLPHKTRILGPRTLPCKLKSDVAANYNSPVDRPVKGEPSEHEPRVRVFIFRTEC